MENTIPQLHHQHGHHNQYPTSLNGPGMQSLASGNSNNSNSEGSGNSALNFFHHSRRNSDNDLGTMDDVQFTASLDALLNGEQMSVHNSACVAGLSSNHNSNHNNNCGGNHSSSNHSNHNNLYATTAGTQDQLGNSHSHQYMVTGATGGMMTTASAPTAPTAPPCNTQQHQQHLGIHISTAHLAGLPLASANQAALHLAPPGPHSAAQLSLSAGHAAATGAFHPNTTVATNPVAGIPSAAQAPTLPWAHMGSITTSTSNAATAAAPVASLAFLGSSNSSAQDPDPTSSKSYDIDGGGGKRLRSSGDMCSYSAVSEDEGERERRRQDRNLREQQRSHRITEQIAQLREVLSAANLQFKPDKYSTLTKVVEYIKQLQERSKLLDVEHKKLIDTISETNEIVNSQYVPAYTSGSDTQSISNDVMGGDGSSSVDDESMSYRGINYKIAFQGCGIPLALASIDGRFLDCNDTFLDLTGYPREELLPLEKPGCQNTVRFSPDQDGSQKKNLSLFNLLSRDGMDQVFMAMSEMLKQPGSIGTTVVKKSAGNELADFWSGPVRLCRQDDLPVKLNVTLVRTLRGRPKFFNCALTALDDENGLRFDDQTTITTPSQSPSDITKETNTSGEQQQQARLKQDSNDGMGQGLAAFTDQGGG